MRKMFFLILLVILTFAGGLTLYAVSPMQTGATYPLGFAIQQGSSFKGATSDMKFAGALNNPFLFEILARVLGKSGEVKAGGYSLSEPATPLALLRKITLGETVFGKLTLIEGWTFADMRRAINAQADLRHDSAKMTDAELLQAIGANVAHPEGWFLPDTYFYDIGSSDVHLYKRALQAMQSLLQDEWQQRSGGLPYRTPEEALIMASIIEKETGVGHERALVAGVFVNRLRIGMRLQTDPTVIYGMGSRYDGNLRRDDLRSDTPYNTYTRAGLPPTPIAMPGAAALHAALNPETTRALYFVASGKGGHVFSTNLDDHNRAVARYLRELKGR